MPFGVFVAHILIALSVGRPAFAVDVFCSDPERMICSNKLIKSDVGETRTSSDSEPLRRATTHQLAARLATAYDNYFRSKASYLQIKSFAERLKLNQSSACWTYLAPGCRSAIARRMADLVSEDQMGFLGESESAVLSRVRSMRDMASLMGEPIWSEMSSTAEVLEPAVANRPNSRATAAQIFANLKARFIEKVKTWPLRDSDKQRMLTRLQGLTYAGQANCNDEPSGLYNDNAFYRARANTVHVCNGTFLVSNSMAMFAFSIGHEIGHSIDPCTLSGAIGRPRKRVSADAVERVYGALIGCLRRAASPESLRGPSDWVSEVGRTSCGDSDQIGELFGDWAAMEVVPDFLQSRFGAPTNPIVQRSRYASAMADMCGLGHVTGDPHPSTRNRINKVAFQNPKVRALVGCGNQPANYCALRAPQGQSSQPATRTQRQGRVQ